MRTDILETIFMSKKEGTKPCYKKIADQYGVDWRTVKRYFTTPVTQVITRKPRIIKTKIDPFKDIINEKLDYKTPFIAIFNFIKSKGYQGSLTTVKNYCRNYVKEKTEEATVRFETNPGFQCQIDWKEDFTLVSKTGEIFTFNVFLAILGYSRYKYIELTLDRSQTTLFRCLTNAIKFFGGVPQEMLFDNMKTVVNRARTQFNKVVFNETFYYFSKDAGFLPKTCIAYRPSTKGKVEVLAKIINRLRVYNNEFNELSDLKKIVRNLMIEINDEIQQTTLEKPSERFLKEKKYLNLETNYQTLEEYYSLKPVKRKVSKEALIMVQNKRYSVPPELVNKVVTVEFVDEQILIYYNNKFVCKHLISDKIFNYRTEDYCAVLKQALRDDDKIEELAKFNLEIYDKF